MDYPKSIPGVGLVDGHFVDENPATGQVGSLIPAAWGDAITQEILNVIKAAGMAPSESNVSQLAAAVQAIAASDIKRSVLVATTGPIALSGLQSIDGVAVPAGARVLVKNQANSAQNWIYVAAAGSWTRAQDADDSAKCTPGHLIGVQSGTANAGAVWQLANTAIPVLGTTALVFTLAIGKTGVIAGEYRRVVVDALGRITGGSNPTTLGGYGITDGATKTEVGSKADKATTLGGYGITDGATKAEVSSKADKATTLGGYGITDAATIALLNSSVAQLLPRAGGLVSGPIYLSNGTNYSPEFAMKTPELEVYMDVANKWFRILATYNNATTFPMVINAAEKSVYFYDNIAWHSGNFNPATKADAALVNQATENSRGTAKVASQSAVNAGVDGESFVAPKTLLGGFRILLANNGYIVFPGWLGGFVIQWASGVNAAVSGGGIISQDIQFPIPFPNAVLGGHVTSKYISGTTTVSYEAASGLNNSKVSVTVVNPVSSGSGVSQPRVYFFGY
ncbi:gp53-like domain-containing protein [Pseudomonas sp. 8(2025)]|uniref:gp53-like domain-containing protein n=1 Tax=Pseudomonas sp. 8(2025) TaxID=3456022 RepID=UPI004043FFA3